MPRLPQFELVSCEFCPYVQPIITLKRKNVDFKLTYIDLENPPLWFEKLSPMGKVPILLVRADPDKAPVVLFESRIINEYLDEVTPPLILPRDPLQRALERGWTEFSVDLLKAIYSMFISQDPFEAHQLNQEVWELLNRVEEAVSDGPFFKGAEFSLVDTAFAPVFTRLDLVAVLREDPHWKSLPKTRRWADSLLALPEVRTSVISDFKEKFLAALREEGDNWISKEV